MWMTQKVTETMGAVMAVLCGLGVASVVASVLTSWTPQRKRYKKTKPGHYNISGQARIDILLWAAIGLFLTLAALLIAVKSVKADPSHLLKPSPYIIHVDSIQMPAYVIPYVDCEQAVLEQYLQRCPARI
jgi:hypothetical protein